MISGPRSWGSSFVIKPVNGYNDVGIVIVDDGVDRFSGWKVRGAADVRALLDFKRIPPAVTRGTYYVETTVRGEPASLLPCCPAARRCEASRHA